MQIKKFEATDMGSALQMIKKEFGPEAVILSAKSLKKEAGIFGALKKSGVVITAAKEEQKHNGARPIYQNIRGYDAYKNNISQPLKRNKSILNNIRSAAKESQYENYNQNKVILEENENSSFLNNIKMRLIDHGVENENVSKIMEHLKRVRETYDTLDTGIVVKDLVHYINTAVSNINEKERNKKSKTIVLVGPSGTGKTTTLAKLAGIHTKNYQKKVGIISLDNHRVAANAKLNIYAKLIGIPIYYARNKKEIIQANKKLRKTDIVFIDTPGIGPKENGAIEELKSMLKACSTPEIFLLVSSVNREKEMKNLVQSFEHLTPSRIIYTKVDECISYGFMLNHIFNSNLPVKYITNGQEVPENISEFNLSEIISKMLIKERKYESGIQNPNSRNFENIVKRVNETDNNYIANRMSQIYHKTNCKWIKRIKEKNIIFFKNRDKAEAVGFKPCRSCVG